ncbi:glycosyltransferase [Anabaena sp. CS-542/02]|uniref:glycosyltransferase n=1 Tax=Anabaena sp. CS-542/02 TaxID=3021719 RepID=UPI00232AA345|nr:glycosyltransferase [Anabaena sp. CS-542/02]MDB9444797.1 glycosyltransferase [Anabaena sp. CS-542/02]
MQKNHKILIIGWFKFPFGSAAASRIRTLAKGLNENGFEVLVVTTARIPLRNEDCTNTGELSWQNIKYETENCYENDGRKLSLIQRIWNYLQAIYKSWVRVYELIHTAEADSIIIYGRSVISYLPVVMLARFYGVPLFYDMVEWFPPSRFKSWLINPMFYDDWLGRHLPLLGSQGVIAITHYISEKYIRHQIPCLILPSIFDYSLSQQLKPPDTEIKDKQFVVLYAGTCKFGDGFENLLDAVKIAFSKGCPIRLDVLGTDGLSGPAAKQRQICEQDEILRFRVRFLGRVSDENYLSTLCSANCLVLPRPDCQTVKAAFPTRLPEFLSTGRPVLTTNVPDVTRYLDAGIHAEIVSGDTSNALADGIIRLWQYPERALQIGIAGQRRGREVFNYHHHMTNLSEFILNTKFRRKQIP